LPTYEELQAQIELLQSQLGTLISEKETYNWDNAPVICILNDSQWLLGPESETELTFNDAISWCASMGGELPRRNILLECFMNEYTRKFFKPSFYWSSTDSDVNHTYSWGQDFYNGYQNGSNKTVQYKVYAVKSIPINRGLL